MIEKRRVANPSIIDLEASGFGPHSYPIEAGVILADGTRYCQLIRPDESWTHWDDEAETVHGIARATLLEHGLPAKEVAGNLNSLIEGSTVYSDAWVVDLPWLRTLFWAAQIEMQFHVSPLESILDEKQIEIWDETRQKVQQSTEQPRHRASTDAEIIKTTFEETLRLTQKR